MKAKVSRGGGFRGALNYVFDAGKKATGKKKAERVGGNMAGNDPMGLSREFAAVRRLRPDVKRPVWHCSLSLPPEERLDSQKWEAVAADFMERMGFDKDTTPWVAVRHQDTDKDHIHIVASRVGLDGKVWLGQWEARKAIEATQELERTHGLTLTPGLGDARAEKKALTPGEINRAVRTGEEPPRQRLQRLIDEALKDKPTALELAERLQAAGVGVRANTASTGRMNGFSFEVGGVPFKGSDLGKAYTWAGLQKAGVTYEQARDREGLERLRAAIADRGERSDVAADSETDAPRVDRAEEGKQPAEGRERRPSPTGQAAEDDVSVTRNSVDDLFDRDAYSDVPVPLAKAKKQPQQPDDDALDNLLAAETAPGFRYPQRSRWRDWRAQTLSRKYDPVYSAEMAERDIYCRWMPEHGGLYLRLGKQEVIDQGPLLLAKNGEMDIPLLIETAKGKGWDTLTFTGSPEFQEKAAIAAVQAGLHLQDKDLEDRLYEATMPKMQNEAAKEHDDAKRTRTRGRGLGD